MPNQPPSRRTEIRRKPQRACYERATIESIVDQALICHVAFKHGGGVHCLPTACWRAGGFLYVHGANNSRLMQALLADECSLAITHLDGLVLARSAFHHSMNYRSVVIYGRFAEVVDAEAKAAAFRDFVEHVSPGRSACVRPASAAELAGTRLARLPLAEAAAKIRNWGVEDAEMDLAIPVWAGVVPLALRTGMPQPDANADGRTPPSMPTFIAGR